MFTFATEFLCQLRFFLVRAGTKSCVKCLQAEFFQEISEKKQNRPSKSRNSCSGKTSTGMDGDKFRSMIEDDIGIRDDMNCLSGSTFASRLTADCLLSSPKM